MPKRYLIGITHLTFIISPGLSAPSCCATLLQCFSQLTFPRPTVTASNLVHSLQLNHTPHTRTHRKLPQSQWTASPNLTEKLESHQEELSTSHHLLQPTYVCTPSSHFLLNPVSFSLVNIRSLHMFLAHFLMNHILSIIYSLLSSNLSLPATLLVIQICPTLFATLFPPFNYSSVSSLLFLATFLKRIMYLHSLSQFPHVSFISQPIETLLLLSITHQTIKRRWPMTSAYLASQQHFMV